MCVRFCLLGSQRANTLKTPATSGFFTLWCEATLYILTLKIRCIVAYRRRITLRHFPCLPNRTAGPDSFQCQWWPRPDLNRCCRREGPMSLPLDDGAISHFWGSAPSTAASLWFLDIVWKCLTYAPYLGGVPSDSFQGKGQKPDYYCRSTIYL